MKDSDHLWKHTWILLSDRIYQPSLLRQQQRHMQPRILSVVSHRRHPHLVLIRYSIHIPSYCSPNPIPYSRTSKQYIQPFSLQILIKASKLLLHMMYKMWQENGVWKLAGQQCCNTPKHLNHSIETQTSETQLFSLQIMVKDYENQQFHIGRSLDVHRLLVGSGKLRCQSQCSLGPNNQHQFRSSGQSGGYTPMLALLIRYKYLFLYTNQSSHHKVTMISSKKLLLHRRS